MNLDGSPINSQLQQSETVPQIQQLTTVSCVAKSALGLELFPVMLMNPVDMSCGTFMRSGTHLFLVPVAAWAEQKPMGLEAFGGENGSSV